MTKTIMVPVGQRLYEERVGKGLTIEDVAKATKIRPSFLLAIEKGQYTQLPSSAYAQGFVRNYASFLGLDGEKMLALFRREFDAKKEYSVLPKGFESKSDFQKVRIKETVVFVALVLFAIISYILFQYRFALLNPPLEVSSPKENASISVQTVEVDGSTDPNATVYVNNTLVSLDQNGDFKKSLDVFPGNTTIRVKAVNRFGKQTEIDRHITVQSD